VSWDSRNDYRRVQLHVSRSCSIIIISPAVDYHRSRGSRMIIIGPGAAAPHITYYHRSCGRLSQGRRTVISHIITGPGADYHRSRGSRIVISHIITGPGAAAPSYHILSQVPGRPHRHISYHHRSRGSHTVISHLITGPGAAAPSYHILSKGLQQSCEHHRSWNRCGESASHIIS
jgi:hypothetical protein